MPVTESSAARFARVEAGFHTDGFSVVLQTPSPKGTRSGCAPTRGRRRLGGHAGTSAARRHLGWPRRHLGSARPGRRKTAFYLEGDNYQMGWLLGFMAEAEVSRMATEFVENVAFAFFDESAAEGGLLGPLKDLIVHLIVGGRRADASRHSRRIPRRDRRDRRRLRGGQRGTLVRRDRLLALNLGIDCVLAHVYTGDALRGERLPPPPAQDRHRVQRVFHFRRRGSRPSFLRPRLHVPHGERVPGYRLPDGVRAFRHGAGRVVGRSSARQRRASSAA